MSHQRQQRSMCHRSTNQLHMVYVFPCLDKIDDVMVVHKIKKTLPCTIDPTRSQTMDEWKSSIDTQGSHIRIDKQQSS